MDELTKLRERIEAIRKRRVESGLKPELPSPFVSVKAGVILYERLKPVKRYVLRLATYLADGHPPDALDIDYGVLSAKERDINVLSYCVNERLKREGLFLRQCLRVIREVGTGEVSSVNAAIMIASLSRVILGRIPDDIPVLTDIPEDSRQSVLDEAYERYEALKHEIEWEG